jgi:hypothetical protein
MRWRISCYTFHSIYWVKIGLYYTEYIDVTGMAYKFIRYLYELKEYIYIYILYCIYAWGL